MATTTTPPPTYRYDAFISYSHKDKQWVDDVLLRRLEQEGLTVCIDTRDFEIGTPSLVNMERAVERSRKTLLVLTPDWVASQWTDFEALLIQTRDPVGRGRRILPLLVRPCQLPDRLSIFTYLDLTDPAEFDAQMARLVAAIREGGSVKPSPRPGDGPDRPVPEASWRAVDYERSLERLAEMLARADAETQLNFAVLETRLRENLRSEGLYGSTETLRHERARIVDELNRIAVQWTDRALLDLSG